MLDGNVMAGEKMKPPGPNLGELDRYKLLFSNSLEGLYFSTPEGRFLEVNPAMAKMAGYESPAEMISAITDIRSQFYARPEDREKMKKALESEDRITGFETEVYRKDGARIRISKNIFVVRDGEGQVLYYAGSCTDITGRTRMEEGLRVANRALRVRGACSKAVIRSGSESELLNQVCRIISEAAGYTRAWIGYAENDPEKSIRPVAQVGFQNNYLESLKISWGDSERGKGPSGTAIRLGTPSTARNIQENTELSAWRKIEAQKQGYNSSIALPLKYNGETLGMLGIYSPDPEAFGDAEKDLLQSLAEDLAHGIAALREREARQKAEEELAEERELLFSLINNIPDAVFFKDPEGRYVFANKAKLKQFGLTDMSEIIGKRIYDFFPNEQADKFSAEDRESLNSGAVLKIWEEQLDIPNGETQWQLNTKVPFLDAKKRPVGLLTICRIITEQKKAEETLKKSVEEKETLLKELQHRVKNNLGLVSSLLSLGIIGIEDQNSRRIFASAQARIRAISAVYEQLYQSADLRTVELDSYIKTLTGKLIDAYAVETDHIRPVLRLTSAVIETRRSVPVGLILNEILTNALKYAYPEGTEGEVLVELEKSETTITVRVSDKGVGLPEGFDPDTSTGLGIKLVKLLAEQIGGTAAFGKGSGGGTSVEVSFPA
jgi:PAS domain S-box-containing protein